MGGSRKACACADVDTACAERQQHIAQNRQTVQKMLVNDLRRVGDRRQVQILVDLYEPLCIAVKAFQRVRVERHAQCGGFRLQQSTVDHSLFFSKYIRSTVTSAGLIPEMREACPTFSGRILDSFSIASSRNPVIFV